MRLGSTTRKIRSIAFPLCGWVSLFTYLLLATGLPIGVPGAGEKDLSQPFPCMNCPCGCRNAEQCWRTCCCHTLAERIAWARENHVQPPAYVLLDARAQGVDLCEGSSASHACCSCCAKAKTKPASHNNSVLLIQSLRCSGIAGDWLGIGIATIPVHCDWQYHLTPCGFLQHPSLDLVSPAFEPLVPPPRQTIS